MIVAVIAVRMMQVPVDEVVHMITVRHRLVPAAGAVLVPGLVLHGGLAGRAAVRVLSVDGDPMLIDVTLVRVVEMPVMQIIGVACVANGDMAAVAPVLMIMVLMHCVIVLGHALFPWLGSLSDHGRPLAANAQLPVTRTILSTPGRRPSQL